MLFILLSSYTWGKTYYVAPTGGSDANPGTITQPWATWQMAFNTARAGDTVFFRGGVWYPASGVNYLPERGKGYNGTYDNLIFYTNYPGEMPILDCSNFPSSTSSTSGFNAEDVTYVKFKGLTIRNVRQTTNAQYIVGAGWTNSGVIYLENVTSTGHGGAGIRINTYDTLYLTNCDSYNNIDPTTTSTIPGGRADGYTIGSGGADTDTFKIAYITGCRAWMNSDDGFDIGSTKQTQISNCWSWNNGRLQGDGCGFKVSYSNVLDASKRVIRNCITAYNYQKDGKFSGGIIEVNLYDEYFGPIYSYYNNSSYNDYVGIGGGDALMDCRTEPAKLIVRNNLVYAQRNPDGYPAIFKACDYTNGNPSYVTEDHNTFKLSGIYGNTQPNPSFSLSDNDFISLDTTQLRRQRKTDGSLPDITFLKLKEGSDLIDAGVNLGLPYSGTAPDIGYAEYDSGSVTIPTPVFVNAVIQNATPTKLEMTYSLTLAGIIPSPTAFTVRVNSVTRTVSSVAVSGTKVTLTLASPVVYGDAVTVAYTKPSANPLQTPDGGQAETLAARNVTNNVAASIPVFTSAVIQNATPAKLEMTYSLTLAGIIPATTAFTVRVNTMTRTVSSVAISGTKVTLTLASPVVFGDAVTVAYTKPSVNPLQASDGGQAATISSQNVINNCSETPNQPPVVNISSPTKNNAFYAPATITIDANASDPDGTVTRVEFYNGQTKLGEATSAPYAFTWKNVPEGTYLISAAATDNKNARTVSTSVTIVVEKAAPIVNQLPVVTIKNPNKGKKFKKSEPIILEAEASDPDGTISKIEFKSGDIILAELTEAPYIFNWQNADTGNYVITAIATDNLGAVSQSTEVDFTVIEVKVPGFTILSLYPNPSDGQFRVEMAEAIDSDRLYTIYSLSGQALYQDKRSGQEITAEFNLVELPAGTYVLAVSSENRIIDTRKFAKR